MCVCVAGVGIPEKSVELSWLDVGGRMSEKFVEVSWLNVGGRMSEKLEEIHLNSGRLDLRRFQESCGNKTFSSIYLLGVP